MPDNAKADIAAELADSLRLVAEKRDRKSFRRLFDHFSPRLRAYLRRLGAADSAAEELVQEVMLTVWRRAAQYDPRQAGVATWVFTIARNRRIDLLRRERRPEIDPHDPALTPSEPQAPDSGVSAHEEERAIRVAVDRLPKEQAALLRMAFFDDKSHSTIADELGLPLGTVKSRLRLALQKLRVALKEIQR
ncbi:MAG: sigma-70 family RNA polymerase sigma factor [Acetobacterales bacterium]